MHILSLLLLSVCDAGDARGSHNFLAMASFEDAGDGEGAAAAAEVGDLALSLAGASIKAGGAAEEGEAVGSVGDAKAAYLGNEPVDFSSPVVMCYCPHCSMPQEYCQYGPKFKELCLPHMQATLSDAELAQALGQASLEGGVKDVGPKKSRIVSKEAAVMETKIVIARIQRQKKKFVTSVLGLDTVPALKGKLDEAAKFFKKKFSCGASVGETPSGAMEVVIQGDVSLELPDKIMQEYKGVAPAMIFFQETATVQRRYA